MLSVLFFVSAGLAPHYGLPCPFIMPLIQAVSSDEDFRKTFRIVIVEVLQIHQAHIQWKRQIGIREILETVSKSLLVQLPVADHPEF